MLNFSVPPALAVKTLLIDIQAEAGPYKWTQTAALDAYLGGAAVEETSTLVYCGTL